MANELAKYDDACRSLANALANAKTVTVAKEIRNNAEALRAYARQAKNKLLQIDAAEITIRAERRVGELIGQQRASVGLHTGGRPAKTPTEREGVSKARLREAGIDWKLSARAQQLAAVPEKKFNAMLTDWRDRVQAETERVTVNLLREGRRRRGGDGPALPSGVYRLLYVDPPWQYEHVATESRAIENQYPTMDLDAIKALEVPAADDAVLFLWATSPKLAEAIAVINAWQFAYRTCAVWDKELIGMGYYFRQQHELLLVAARGALPVPAPSDRVSSVIRARREAHSQKPAIVYDVLEAMYPTFGELDRVELFQRQPRAGWAGWGNEQEAAS